MKTFASAVVGCGRMGAFTSESMRLHAPDCWHPLSHAEAISLNPRLSLSALCDINPDYLSRAAARYEVDRTFADASELLRTIQPDLLTIATRTMGRADLIETALAHGVRALHVEKPLCNSIAELTRLRATVAADKVFLTYGTIRRFFSIFQEARDLALSGQFGALREIRVNMGAGQLFWTHPHSIDLILFGAGERRVTGVQARLSDVETGSSPVEIVSDPMLVGASIHFDDGVAGHITRAHGFDFVLSCADAEISVKVDGSRIEILSTLEDKIYPSSAIRPLATPAPSRQGTYAPIAQLVRCLEGDAEAIAANGKVKQDILLGQQIAFAMVQSHLESSRIIAPEAADDDMYIHARTGQYYA